MENIYKNIAERTGGNIYIGVVGPVRTGKSTFIKRIMEQLVIPNIEDVYRRERAKDELPQSGSGKTIMTSEPKFVPEDAIEISPDGLAKMRIRMIDSVGYMVNGAVGAHEDGEPRMVTTPWFDYEIPMTEAAELGTKKVMQEHCSMGIVVTTDGTVTDIDRQDYIEAESHAIEDMKKTGKPFLVIVNSREPSSAGCQQVKKYLYQKFGVEAACLDCQSLEEEQIKQLLKQILYTFPLQELRVHLPRWMDVLEQSHPVKAGLYEALLDKVQNITSLLEAENVLMSLRELEHVLDFSIRDIDLGTGTVSCSLGFAENLFYEILSSRAGTTIENDGQLLSLLSELAKIKQEYDKISEALTSVKATGYGVVMPTGDEMSLDKPEILRKGGAFGVKLKASAPSIHMIRVDVDTQINPTVGSEEQSQELISYLCAQEPDKLWQSNIFGKSVYDMIREGLTGKLLRTPEDVRDKFRGSLTRIVNEGATGLICLIL